mmetsp:Transcript_52962/g.119066  ORF Transcript_52962/g.119066 Transcript_52962/m.119066 type:complete len:341 (+) Transcript_52962:69-1091(+)
MPAPGDYGPRGQAQSDDDDGPSKFHFGNLYKSGRYVPRHKDLFESPARWDLWLEPAFLLAHSTAKRVLPAKAGKGSKGGAQPAATKPYQDFLKVECTGGGAGVYSFPCFTSEYCQKLVEEVDHAQANYASELSRPNGMNRFGMVLNQLGLEPAITEFQQEYIRPMQEFLYGAEGAHPDDHHCFVVRYKKGEDVGLDMHSDSSDITLNVCLGRNFKGSTLSFCGVLGNRKHRRFQHTYSHQIGRAVIHLGRQRHGADDLESGERLNLILWNTSSEWRQSDAYIDVLQSRRKGEEGPDLICLSYTHDEDYTKYRDALADADAVSRGVMLSRVRSNPNNACSH